MRKYALLGTLAALAMMGIASAAKAEPGFSTANVNIRTGPDTEFPSIGVIPEGDLVDVRGCLSDESWCDVRWAGNRGWVFSEYLAFDYRGEPTPLPDIGLSVFSIPVVTFVGVDYWRRHYIGRPWYHERDRWIRFQPRPRIGWRPPPPGPRHPGWWRSGYKVHPGMRPPPDRGWRRPSRHDGPGHDGRRHDGPRHEGRRDDGPRRDGPRHEGRRDDGPRRDGPRHEGRRDDGPRRDGPRHEGRRDDGPRRDGARQEARRDERRGDGPRQDGRRHEGYR